MRRLELTAGLSSLFLLAACGPQTEKGVDQNASARQTAAADEFLWLDGPHERRALAWVREANEKTVSELSGDPRLEEFEREAAKILTAPDRLPKIRIRGGFVYDYRQDADRVFGVWRRSPYDAFLDGSPDWETLLDLDALSRDEGREWILQGVSFAPGASSRVLIRLAHKGQDAFELREYDLAAKSFVENGFALPESKSRVWWRDENTLILASALDGAPKTEAGAPMTLALWPRGASADSPNAPYFTGAPTDYTVFPAFSGVTRDKLAVAQATDFFSRDYWIIDPDGTSQRLPLPAKMDVLGTFDDALVVLLKQDWTSEGAAFRSGDVVSFSADGLVARQAIENAQVVYRPAADEQVRDFRILAGSMHLNLLKSVRGRIVSLDKGADGFSPRVVDDDADGFIELGPSAPGGDAVFATYEGPLSPPALYLLTGETGEKTLVARQAPAFDHAGLKMEMRSVASDDGENIPYTVIYSENAPDDAERATIVYGYGGFDVSVTPRYEPLFGKLWLERGGVYVHAHLRGGGEFGPKWHDAPMLERRPRAYEDMAAVLRALDDAGVSTPERIGVMGRSNGGLMTAAVMLRYPELMNAAVVGGPLIDMLRYDKIGPGASWTAEYGDPDDDEARRYLAAYSPMQNIDPEAAYPRPLIITSQYDDRVWPGHARRFAARLAAAGHDALYFEDDAGGHYWELAGGPSPGDWRKRARARALEYVYLARALELE